MAEIDKFLNGLDFSKFTQTVAEGTTSELFKKETISPDLAFPVENVKFNANASAGFSLYLYNDPSDHKRDGVEDKTAKYWEELKQVYSDGGLLVYSFDGGIKGSAAGDAGKFSLGINAEQSLTTRSYLFHDRKKAIAQAIVDDLKKFKIIFSKDDVLTLGVNQALTMEASGRIELSAEVKLSDAISGTASVIADALNINGKIKFKADAAVKLSFNVGIEDDFHVAFIRFSDEKFRVVVSKLIKRTLEAGAKAGITAGIDNEDKEVDKLVDQVFEAVEETVFKEVNRLISTTGLKQEHLELAVRAAQLLGIATDFDGIQDFVKKYKELRDNAKKKIIEVFTTKVELGMSYEYQRIQSNESLFTAELTKEGIKTFYGKIMRLQLRELVDSPQNADYKIIKYFRRDLLEVDSSFGIGLTFGKFKLSAKQKAKLEEEKIQEVTNQDRKIKINSYTTNVDRTFHHGAVGKDEFDMNFAGRMPVFVSEESELTAEKFDFGFGLSLEITDKRLSKGKNELLEAVDWAMTWDIIKPEQFKETVEAIEKNVIAVDNNVVKYKFFINVDQSLSEDKKSTYPIFDLLIPKLASASDQAMASALAAATPFAEFKGNADANRIRQDVTLRRQRYASFWLNYLRQAPSTQAAADSQETYAKTLADQMALAFDQQGMPDLAEFERSPVAASRHFAYTSLQALIQSNFIFQDAATIRDSFKILNGAIQSKTAYKKAFNQFDNRLSRLRFHRDFQLRFIGRLMLDLADELHVKNQITRSLSITYQDNGKDKVYVIG